MKIALAGFQHETNTFAGTIAARSDFDLPGGWPPFSVNEEMREIIGADSLSFLSLDGMVQNIGRTDPGSKCGHCLACFTGEYPTNIFPDTVLPHEKEKVK